MNHTTIFKKKGTYAAFPVLDHLTDGRLTIGFSRATFRDHSLTGSWTVLLSTDEGNTWSVTENPDLPANWPASNTRERSDRFAAVMANGDYVCAGKVGTEVWPASRKTQVSYL